MKLKGETGEEEDSNDKRVFILLNVPISDCKGTWMFLKAVWLSMFGPAYSSSLKNPARSEMVKQFVSSKVRRKIYDHASCLACFK